MHLEQSGSHDYTEKLILKTISSNTWFSETKRKKKKRRNGLKLHQRATAQPGDPEAQAGTVYSVYANRKGIRRKKISVSKGEAEKHLRF